MGGDFMKAPFFRNQFFLIVCCLSVLVCLPWHVEAERKKTHLEKKKSGDRVEKVEKKSKEKHATTKTVKSDKSENKSKVKKTKSADNNKGYDLGFSLG